MGRPWHPSLADQLEDVADKLLEAAYTWEQLIGVRSFEQAIQIQSDYAKRVYEHHMAEMKKLGEMTVGMVRDASQPAEDASRKFR